MLKIVVPMGEEQVVETPDGVEFIQPDGVTLELEHSLVSISKWEAEWEKPFLAATEKTDEETYSYIELMLLTPDVPAEVLANLSPGNINEINAYINKKMTATWFSDTDNKKPSRETITNELIYYWMIALNIPIECESWHLNRLLTLVRVCNQKNSPPKKMSSAEAMAQQRRMNEERRAQMGTSG